MRTRLPAPRKPFAQWSGRALSVARLTAQHTRVSAKFSVEPSAAQRFNLRLWQQCLAAARASQRHPFTRGVKVIFGTGAHGLIDPQNRLVAQPKIREVGLIGYLSLLPLRPLRAGYALALKSVFGEALYEPRMLRILDRAVYWTTACSCEVSAIIGLGVRYLAVACFVTATLPRALALSIKAAWASDKSYEGLTLRGHPGATPEQLEFLLRGRTVASDAMRRLSGFECAVDAGLVSIESPALHTGDGEAKLINPLTRTLVDIQESALHNSSDFSKKAFLTSQSRIERLCSGELEWAERIFDLTQRTTLEALVQTISLQEHLFLHGQKGRLEASDGASELRLLQHDERTVSLRAEVVFDAPHPVYARFDRTQIGLSYTRVRCLADIIIRRDAPIGRPYEVVRTDVRISPMLGHEL